MKEKNLKMNNCRKKFGKIMLMYWNEKNLKIKI